MDSLSLSSVFFLTFSPPVVWLVDDDFFTSRLVYRVGFLTQVNGIAYVANNIYFSSWLTLFSCIYTLNKWSTSKDILSIAELTGVSATLKSWYVLFVSSLVVLGTSVDLTVKLGVQDRQDSSFGVALGAASAMISLAWILIHYNFFDGLQEGGWFELSSSFLLILVWIIGLAILTQDQGVAATLTGTQCTRNQDNVFESPQCMIVILSSNNETNGTTMDMISEIPCSQLPRQVPGSNLYFAAWTSFVASLNVTFRWKAAQALQFAQAQQEQRRKELGSTTAGTGEGDLSDEDAEDDEDAI